jgi:hypothetical protein
MYRYAVDHPEYFHVWIIPEIFILDGRSASSIHQELALGFSVDLSSLRTFVDKYFSEFSGIFKWRQAVVARAKAKNSFGQRLAGQSVCR